MLPEKKGALGKGILLGIGLSVVSTLLFTFSQSLGALLLGFILAIASTVLFVRGCWQHAQGKGYAGVVGLLGLLGLIGLIILLVLPDKHPENLGQTYAYTPSPAFETAAYQSGSTTPQVPVAPYSPATATQPTPASYYDSGSHWSVKAGRPQ